MSRVASGKNVLNPNVWFSPCSKVVLPPPRYRFCPMLTSFVMIKSPFTSVSNTPNVPKILIF